MAKAEPPAPGRRHLPLAAAALFIATIIWLMAKQSALQTQRLTVPVFIDNVPATVYLTYQPTQAPIMVTFPQMERGRFSVQNFEIRLDARALFGDDPRHWAGVEAPAAHTHPLSLSDVRAIDLPPTIRVTQIIGPQNQIRLEATLLSHLAKIRPQTRGRLPELFELRDEVRSEPSAVRVTGTAETLQRFTQDGGELLTQPIELDGQTADFIRYVPLRIPAGLELLREEERQVQVTVAVVEKEVVRTVADVPIRLYVFNDRLEARVAPPVANVQVRGRGSLIDQLDGQSFVFDAVEPLPEEAGLKRRVELRARLSEDVPLEVREKVQVEGLADPVVTVEIVQKG